MVGNSRTADAMAAINVKRALEKREYRSRLNLSETGKGCSLVIYVGGPGLVQVAVPMSRSLQTPANGVGNGIGFNSRKD